jgi:hypothetical protein
VNAGKLALTPAQTVVEENSVIVRVSTRMIDGASGAIERR